MEKIYEAIRTYRVAGSKGNLDQFIEGRVKGQRVEVRPGTVVTVSSVTNAGFNGMQVGGWTDQGIYQIGFVTRY